MEKEKKIYSRTKIAISFFSNWLLLFGIVAKAIWSAAINVVSLFAYSILLIALVSYYGIDQSSINSLMDLTQSLMRNWVKFFVIFVLLSIYDNWWRFK